MARDKLTEIAAIRGRGQPGAWRAKHAITELHGRSGDGFSYPASFVIIRLVTALEVFTRDWVKELVDAGEPYIGRAASLLKGTLKIDFAVAQGLVGKQVTFGDLVAHDIPLNSIADVDRVFSHLLETSLFDRLKTVINRWDVEIVGKPPTPILSNPRETRALLGRLFELRHIHVHELPDEAHIEPETVTGFVTAAMSFCEAVDEALSTELQGDYPLTQAAMNEQAGEQAQNAEDDLKAVIARLDPTNSSKSLRAAQEAWEGYRERQAEFRSGINSPTRGSIAPMIYASEVEKITRARIDELEWYLNRKEGDL